MQGGLPVLIKFSAQKVNMGSQKMLELSRTVRKYQKEAEDVRCQLQQLTEMEACRSAIFRAEESLALIAGRTVYLSSALEEVSGLYSSAERRNADALKKYQCPAPGMENTPSSRTDSEIHGHM